MTEPLTELPTCPRCGSTNGSLGTSYAYFMCHACKAHGHHLEVYWTPDHEHPGDWAVAIAASPWAVERQRRERMGEPGEGWPPRP